MYTHETDRNEAPVLGHDDNSLSRSAVTELNRNALVPWGIRVTVSKSWVTLQGSTEWPYVRAEAQRTVQRIPGVAGVSNLIRIDERANLGWSNLFKVFWKRMFPAS
jgi:osmotically-inducible protein OsmY